MIFPILAIDCKKNLDVLYIFDMYRTRDVSHHDPSSDEEGR